MNDDELLGALAPHCRRVDELCRRLDLSQYRRGRNATNTMLLWNPCTGDVLLKDYPERDGNHRDYSSHLACWGYLQKATPEQRKTVVFIEASHLVVRDGIDPLRVHFTLLGLEEYRAGCSHDMPGLAKVCRHLGEEVPRAPWH